MRINYGLERRKIDTNKKRYESKNGTLELPQFADEDWDIRHEAVYVAAMTAIKAENPGWSVQGFALIREPEYEHSTEQYVRAINNFLGACAIACEDSGGKKFGLFVEGGFEYRVLTELRNRLISGSVGAN